MTKLATIETAFTALSVGDKQEAKEVLRRGYPFIPIERESRSYIAISPVLLGSGERLFEGVDLRTLEYECIEYVASEKAAHVVLRRQSRNNA